MDLEMKELNTPSALENKDQLLARDARQSSDL